jgi:CheY-like chemotaxis protein
MCSAVSPTSETERAARRAAILCVDDSQTMLTICQTMLEANGYKVHTASDGKAGLQILERHPIDLIVVDNRMPGMTGAELAKEIKRIYRDLPVLMFSDSGDEPTTSKSVDLLINKMSGPRALCDAVGTLLSRFSGRK